MLVKPVYGREIRNYIDVLASLRIKVFREYPYLYDGNIKYEKDYLESFAQSDKSILFLAEDKGCIVGATTGLPLAHADRAFQNPFKNSDYDINGIFYLGESVLLPQYRKKGIGGKFFQAREEFARKMGYNNIVFCAVNRDKNHKFKPENYKPLDNWWVRLGYQRQSALICNFKWKEIGAAEEKSNSLTFWHKNLD